MLVYALTTQSGINNASSLTEKGFTSVYHQTLHTRNPFAFRSTRILILMPESFRLAPHWCSSPERCFSFLNVSWQVQSGVCPIIYGEKFPLLWCSLRSLEYILRVPSLLPNIPKNPFSNSLPDDNGPAKEGLLVEHCYICRLQRQEDRHCGQGDTVYHPQNPNIVLQSVEEAH